MSQTRTLILLAVFAGTAMSLAGQGQFKADLNGYDEVPSLSTTGAGQISVRVSEDQRSLTVMLTFTKLEGVAQSARLRFGTPGTSGGVLASICGSPKPSCPTLADGSVTATIAPNDVQAVPAQGIAAADLAALIRALQNGAVYADVSTSKYPNGEIRGQLARGLEPGNGRGRGR